MPIAPGTAGSFAGVLLFGLMGWAATDVAMTDLLALYGLAIGLLLLVGIRAAGRAEIDFGRRDDRRIVIDEVVGQLISLAPLVPLLWVVNLENATRIDPLGFRGNDVFVLLFEVVTGFVLFRLFDVWKPGVIGWAERRLSGGLGVMADDVLAGIHAALCLFGFHTLIFARFYSEWPWVWANASWRGISPASATALGFGASL